jgi:hypothetical protein
MNFLNNSDLFSRFCTASAPNIAKKMLTWFFAVSLVVGLGRFVCNGQRTPTISYVTPPITTKIGGTIEMDCSVLYATEYPILWVKLPGYCAGGSRASYNIRSQVSDQCTPVPLSSGSALIVRDNRFRYANLIHNYQKYEVRGFMRETFFGSRDPSVKKYITYFFREICVIYA